MKSNIRELIWVIFQCSNYICKEQHDYIAPVVRTLNTGPLRWLSAFWTVLHHWSESKPAEWDWLFMCKPCIWKYWLWQNSIPQYKYFLFTCYLFIFKEIPPGLGIESGTKMFSVLTCFGFIGIYTWICLLGIGSAKYGLSEFKKKKNVCVAFPFACTQLHKK